MGLDELSRSLWTWTIVLVWFCIFTSNTPTDSQANGWMMNLSQPHSQDHQHRLVCRSRDSTAGLKGHGTTPLGMDWKAPKKQTSVLLEPRDSPHTLQCLAAQAAWVSYFLPSFMEMNLQEEFKELFCNTSLGKTSQVQMACEIAPKQLF